MWLVSLAVFLHPSLSLLPSRLPTPAGRGEGPAALLSDLHPWSLWAYLAFSRLPSQLLPPSLVLLPLSEPLSCPLFAQSSKRLPGPQAQPCKAAQGPHLTPSPGSPRARVGHWLYCRAEWADRVLLGGATGWAALGLTQKGTLWVSWPTSLSSVRTLTFGVRGVGAARGPRQVPSDPRA